MTNSAKAIRDIVASYDDPVIRFYSRVRFTIFRQIFLEEIGQYLPRAGRILDLGCGFGLFSLYYATLARERRITGIDRNARRIGIARTSAERLGLTNVSYSVGDGLSWESDENFDAIYLLDLVHHLRKESVAPFLAKLRSRLAPGGVLIVKDIENRPWHRTMFTLVLDRLMVGTAPIYYWSPAELTALLSDLGFDTVRHRMRDLLPYPHIIYVSRLSGSAVNHVPVTSRR